VAAGEQPAWSPDARTIAFVRTAGVPAGGELWISRADGSGQRRLTTGHDDGEPAWSPDGGRLAFTRRVTPADSEVFVIEVATGAATNLTRHPAPDGSPSWSPDGTRIAFSSRRLDAAAVLNEDVYAMGSDGSSLLRLTTDAAADRQPDWSPDGSALAFASDRDGDAEIYAMRADGSEQRRLTFARGADEAPAWSPDGGMLAFTSHRFGVEEVWIASADGARTQFLQPGAAADWQALQPTSVDEELRAGDLFVAGPEGSVRWLRDDGSWVADLVTGLPSVRVVAADRRRRLWVSHAAFGYYPDGLLNRLVLLDERGVVSTTRPVGETIIPNSIAFDALGNAYVGDWDVFGKVSRFSAGAAFLGVAVDSESDYIDLAPDQCTLFLQRPGISEGATERWDACTGRRLGVFHEESDGTETAKGVRLLPDGTVLVKAASGLLRVDAEGRTLRTYEPRCLRPRALSPDGSSFYAECGATYEVDVETGGLVRVVAVDAPLLAVMGEFRAAEDRTPPAIAVSAPAPGATYALGAPVLADYACTDAGGSLLVSCAGDVAAGAALDTSSIGLHTFRVRAVDGAGNVAEASRTYRVVWPFEVLPPYSGDALNEESAARTIAVEFRLGGDRGPDVVRSLTVAPADCAGRATGAPAPLAYKLRWKPEYQGGLYVLRFEAPKSWQRSCRELALGLADESTRTLRFRFG
jgi:hypothetical protein